MANDVPSPSEFEVGVTQLRDSLGFTVRCVADSGEPVIVRRYSRAEVILVPLREWRRLKQIEADLFLSGQFLSDEEDHLADA